MPRRVYPPFDECLALCRRGPDDCWDWPGFIQQNGYGSTRGRRADGAPCTEMAHRRAYETLVGPIPDGLTIDHLCRNRRCINPGHMEPVGQGDNVLRGDAGSSRNARKTHCRKGHPFSGANLYLHPRPKNRQHRVCRACHAERQRERKRRLRQSA